MEQINTRGLNYAAATSRAELELFFYAVGGKQSGNLCGNPL